MASIDPGDRTIDELADDIREIDDAEELEDLLEAERRNEDRKGAKELIERRLDTVGADGDGTDGDTADRENGSGADGSADTGNGDSADEEGDATDGNRGDGSADLIQIQDTLQANATDLIGHRLDSITEISQGDDGWRAVVDVVERPSVPDTQDIIGRYEVDLDESGAITGFRRLSRYRRGETSEAR